MIRATLILVSVIGLTSGTCCPDTWVNFQGSCYLFGHQHPMTFVETEHFCQQHKAHMVHVESTRENMFLKDTLMGMKDDNRWMGLTDEIVEGIWKWYDTDEEATFFDWFTNEPQGGTNEDCVSFAKGGLYQWADYPCDTPMQAICEKRTEENTEGIVG